jgi:cytochrome c peroxidase
MEYLTGIDIRALLQERGRLPAEEAVDYILQACEAIAEAHAAGIVHRDLKPSNLFLAEGTGGVTSLKVLDFGISKAIAANPAAQEDSLTATHAVMGSFLYMAPEQVRGMRNADTRSDVWALGVCLFQMLTGRRPFQGKVMTESLLMIAEDAPPTFASLDVQAPPGLEAVVLWCMEKDRQHRPQAISDLVTALEPFGSRMGSLSVERVLRAQSRDPLSERGMSGPGSTRLSSRAFISSPGRATLPSSSSLPSLPASTPNGDESSPVATRTAPTRLRTLRSSQGGESEPKGRSRWGLIAGALVLLTIGVFGLTRGLRALSRFASEIDTERLASFAPLRAAPAVQDRSANAVKIKLGRALFRDPKLSRDGDVACSSCHELERYGVDGKRRSRGTDHREPPRNTLSVYNTAGVFAYLWDGRMATLEDQVEEALLSDTAMSTTRERLEKTLSASAYTAAFREAFPDDREPISVRNAQRAIAAFEESLFTPGRWDRFLEGDKSALSPEEKAGFNRFVDVGCISCHFGANVGATMFQKVGLVKAWPDTRDRGRYEITRREADWMVFKVPSLRNVAETAPYFHDGSIASLEEAVRMMARHQIGKELDREDVSLILAWLRCLTGDIPRDAIAPPAPQR